jgi:hypothetical protein
MVEDAVMLRVWRCKCEEVEGGKVWAGNDLVGVVVTGGACFVCWKMELSHLLERNATRELEDRGVWRQRWGSCLIAVEPRLDKIIS